MLSVSRLGDAREAFTFMRTWLLIRAGKENKHAYQESSEVSSAVVLQAQLSNSESSDPQSDFTFLYSVDIYLNID